MRTWRQYKNYSRHAKISAWCIDLTAGTLFKIAAACGRAIRSVFPVSGQGPPAAKKLLLIRLDHIGDLLMTTPAIHALKLRFPESSLCLLASPAALPIIAGNPEIDRTFSFRVPWYDGGRAQRFSCREYIRLLRQLRRERFDAAIDFRGDFRVLLFFSFLGKAKQRVGYAALGGEFLLTRSCPYDENRHFVDANLALANCLDGPPASPGIQYFVNASPAIASHVDKFLSKLGIGAGDSIIGIHPATIPHWRLKRWAPARFAALADALARREGVKIVLTGGKEDVAELENIVSLMREKAWITAGRTSIPQLVELIRRCRLFVSNDTGPMHIAAAVATPLVAIFGPTDPQRSGPNGNPRLIRVIRHDVPCRRPCFVAECTIGHECMNGIEVADALQACEELLRLQTVPGENPQ